MSSLSHGSAAVARPNRRSAFENGVTVVDLMQILDDWMTSRGSRDLARLLKPLLDDVTHKTAPQDHQTLSIYYLTYVLKRLSIYII